MVNERFLVEEVYERRLALAEQYQQNHLIEELNVTEKSYGTIHE